MRIRNGDQDEIIDTRTRDEPSPKEKKNPKKGRNEVYYVRSAQHRHHHSSSASSRRRGYHRRERDRDTFSGPDHYEVRLWAWNCSCPAFTFSAFSGSGSGSGTGSWSERGTGTGINGGSTSPTVATAADTVFSDQQGGSATATATAPTLTEHYLAPEAQNDREQADETDETDEQNQPPDPEAWTFGGLSLPFMAGGGSGVPVCKHLLACVLGERMGMLGAFVEERVVSRGEGAGLGAGWGG